MKKNPGKTVLAARVTPGAPRDEVAGWMDDGSLKIKIRAAPEKGKANEALASLLARKLDVPRTAISILSGASSRRKKLAITGVTARQLKRLAPGGGETEA